MGDGPLEGDGPLHLSITAGPNHNADVFRSVFGIDSAQQASDALNNLDSLWTQPDHMWSEYVFPDGKVMPADREGFDAAARRVKELYDDGTYKDGELAESKPTEDGQDLWGNSTHVANESSEWKAVCIAPDYCKVGNSVVPFDSYANIGHQTQSSPNVKAQGTPVYRVGDMHKGIEADAGEGIPSGTSKGDGYVKFLTGQDNVKVNGLPMVRQDSLCLVNCNAAGVGGALGKVVTAEKGTQTEGEGEGDGEPNDALQALIDKENDERSFWQKTKDFGRGAWDGTKRLAGAAWDNPGDFGVGVLKGIGNLPSDLWNLGVMASKYSGPMSPAIMSHILESGAMEAYRAGNIAQANAMAARASEMMSSGYVGDIFELSNDAQQAGSFASIVVPVGTIVKGAGTAAKVGRTVKAGDTVAGAARAGNAADVAKAGNAAGDAGKASRSGVHIKPPPPKYTITEFKGRRVYKNNRDIDPGKPEYVDPSVNKHIRQRIDDGWTNKDLMEHGYGPIGRDGKQINLHHILGQEPGPMVELTTTTHQQYSRQLHGLIQDGTSFRNNPVLNKQYNDFRASWWKNRAKDF